MTLNQTDTIVQDNFSLRPFICNHRKLSLAHCFSSQTQKAPLVGNKMTTVIPVFNSDSQYFTPTFVLSIDQSYYVLNEEFELQKHIDKIRLANIEISNSDLHPVSPSSNFCQVCRTSYEDYYIHISEAAHKKSLKKPTAHRYIEQLCSAFTKNHSKPRNGKSRKIRKESLKSRKTKEPETQIKLLASYPTNSISFTNPLQ